MSNQEYANTELTREEVDTWPGGALLQFGTNWCGHCMAAEPVVDRALSSVPGVRQVKVEDGPGRALGRSFRVKLWPTLIFLKDGVEQSRLVRPESAEAIREELQRLSDA